MFAFLQKIGLFLTGGAVIAEAGASCQPGIYKYDMPTDWVADYTVDENKDGPYWRTPYSLQIGLKHGLYKYSTVADGRSPPSGSEIVKHHDKAAAFNKKYGIDRMYRHFAIEETLRSFYYPKASKHIDRTDDSKAHQIVLEVDLKASLDEGELDQETNKQGRLVTHNDKKYFELFARNPKLDARVAFYWEVRTANDAPAFQCKNGLLSLKFPNVPVVSEEDRMDPSLKDDPVTGISAPVSPDRNRIKDLSLVYIDRHLKSRFTERADFELEMSMIPDVFSSSIDMDEVALTSKHFGENKRGLPIDRSITCAPGQYTAFTGAHAIIVTNKMAKNQVMKGMMAMPDTTRKFDMRFKRGGKPEDASRPEPWSHLEFKNIYLECVGKDEVEGAYQKTLWKLPTSRRDSPDKFVYYPLNEEGLPNKADPDHFKMRFSLYLSKPTYLDDQMIQRYYKLRSTTDNSGHAQSMDTTIAEKFAAYSRGDKHLATEINIGLRGKYLLFDPVKHLYTLLDHAKLQIDRRPDMLPMLSWSSLAKWFLGDFEPYNKQRNSHASGNLDNNGLRKWNEIVQYWNKRRDEGTALHLQAERYWNMLNDPVWSERLKRGALINRNPEWHLSFLVFAKEFVVDLWKARPFATELRMFFRPILSSGTMDMLFERENPRTGETEYIMCDWKRMAVMDSKQYADDIAENWIRVEQYFRKLGAGGYVTGDKTSKLYAQLKLIHEQLQAPWNYSKTTKYRLQLLFYKWMAEMAFGIEIKYAWIVALNPLDKKTEQMLYLDRAIGAEVYLVDGRADMMNARLQQIVQTRHAMLLDSGYKWGGSNMNGLNRNEDMPRSTKDLLPIDGPDVEVNVDGFVTPKSDISFGHLVDIPVKRNTPKLDTITKTYQLNFKGQKNVKFYDILDIDHSDGTIVKIKDQKALDKLDPASAKRTGDDKLKVGDRISEVVLASAGAKKVFAEYLITMSPLRREEIFSTGFASDDATFPIINGKMRSSKQRTVTGFVIIRDAWHVKRDTESVFDKMDQEGFTPLQMEKLKAFVPSWEENVEKLRGLSVGSKIWDSAIDSIGTVVHSEVKLNEEPKVIVEFKDTFVNVGDANALKSILGSGKLPKVEKRRVTLSLNELLNPHHFHHKIGQTRFQESYTFASNVSLQIPGAKDKISTKTVELSREWKGIRFEITFVPDEVVKTIPEVDVKDRDIERFQMEVQPGYIAPTNKRINPEGHCGTAINQGKIPFGASGIVRDVRRNGPLEQSYSVEFRSRRLDFLHPYDATNTDTYVNQDAWKTIDKIDIIDKFGIYNLRRMSPEIPKVVADKFTQANGQVLGKNYKPIEIQDINEAVVRATFTKETRDTLVVSWTEVSKNLAKQLHEMRQDRRNFQNSKKGRREDKKVMPEKFSISPLPDVREAGIRVAPPSPLRASSPSMAPRVRGRSPSPMRSPSPEAAARTASRLASPVRSASPVHKLFPFLGSTIQEEDKNDIVTVNDPEEPVPHAHAAPVSHPEDDGDAFAAYLRGGKAFADGSAVAARKPGKASGLGSTKVRVAPAEPFPVAQAFLPGRDASPRRSTSRSSRGSESTSPSREKTPVKDKQGRGSAKGAPKKPVESDVAQAKAVLAELEALRAEIEAKFIAAEAALKMVQTGQSLSPARTSPSRARSRSPAGSRKPMDAGSSKHITDFFGKGKRRSEEDSGPQSERKKFRA